NIPRAGGRFSAKCGKQIRHRVVRVAVVNAHIQIGDAGAAAGTATSASTAPASEAAPTAALATLRHGAEGVHEPHVDVVELTRCGSDGMKVLTIAVLIWRRNQI